MKNSNLDHMLMRFIRDRNSISQESIDLLFSPENIEYSDIYITSMKRDVESQFVAWSARKHDALASFQEAKRMNIDMIIELEEYDPSTGSKLKTTYELPPAEAYSRLMAQEARWKTKNVRFLSLIENALAALKLGNRDSAKLPSN